MAEFAETMKQWKRMCDAMDCIYGEDACIQCRLKGVSCGAIFEMDSNSDFDDIAKIIMQWAAENPEPAYPTWAEWLKGQGFVTRKTIEYVYYRPGVYVDYRPGVISHKNEDVDVLADKAYEPITADIAEKLGVHPKMERTT